MIEKAAEFEARLKSESKKTDVQNVFYEAPSEIWDRADLYKNKDPSGTHFVVSFKSEACFPKSRRGKLSVLATCTEETQDDIIKQCIDHEMTVFLGSGKILKGKIMEIMGNVCVFERGWTCVPPVLSAGENIARCKHVLDLHNKESKTEAVDNVKLMEERVEKQMKKWKQPETTYLSEDEVKEQKKQDEINRQKRWDDEIEEIEKLKIEDAEMGDEERETNKQRAIHQATCKWMLVVNVFPKSLEEEKPLDLTVDSEGRKHEPSWVDQPLRGAIFLEGPFLTQGQVAEAAGKMHNALSSCRIGTFPMGGIVDIPMPPHKELDAQVKVSGNALMRQLNKKDEDKAKEIEQENMRQWSEENEGSAPGGFKRSAQEDA